jgi:hypothetical protein
VTSLIHTVLWPGIKEICGDDVVNSGITVNKGGYHSTRSWLKINRPSDYSIQLDIDKVGPTDEGAALDVTFKTAQGGDYRNISKFMKRLIEAGKNKDPRTYPLREAFGNSDLDKLVEGWSYYRGTAMTSDPSHAWHIHQSIHRKYINDRAAMESILSIWRGEAAVVYPKPKSNDVYLSKLVLGQQDSDSVWQLQNALKKLGSPVNPTGDFGKATFEAWATEVFNAAEISVDIINDL